MPNKIGFLQAALGALCTLALFAVSTLSSEDPKHKRVSGILERSGAESLIVTEDSSRKVTLKLTPDTVVLLNEKTIALADLKSGRRATVFFQKLRGELIARKIEIYPIQSDFES